MEVEPAREHDHAERIERDAGREILAAHVHQRDLPPHGRGDVGHAELGEQQRRPRAEAVHEHVAGDALLAFDDLGGDAMRRQDLA